MKKRILQFQPQCWILIAIAIALLAVNFTSFAKKARTPKRPEPIPVSLSIVQQQLTINGETIKVFNIVQPDGMSGLVAQKGQILDVTIKNHTDEATAIHWHGLILPNNQDGAPFLTQQPIPPGGEFRYKFPLIQSGTFWLQSHYKSQLQQLMAAPFIVLNPADAVKNQQNVIMFLQDITFRHPKAAYPQLRQKLLQRIANIKIEKQQSLYDDTSDGNHEIAMDAYLTNRKTLANPDIIRIQPGNLVRLRVINAAANSNFFIDLGQLQGRIIAADSEAVDPLEGSKFQLGQGQRLDIEIVMPAGDNVYPILAQAEGTKKLTGLVLASPDAIVPTSYSDVANQGTEPFDYNQELNLRGLYPLLPHTVNHSYNINLMANMLSYIWTMNGQVWPNVVPLQVKAEDRVEVALNNKTGIPISVHLHGHVFQITEIEGKKIKGAIRDTVLVLPYSTVKIQFDAENPGIWLLRAAIPFLNYGNMATLIHYEGHMNQIFNQKDTGVSPKF